MKNCGKIKGALPKLLISQLLSVLYSQTYVYQNDPIYNTSNLISHEY